MKAIGGLFGGGAPQPPPPVAPAPVPPAPVDNAAAEADRANVARTAQAERASAGRRATIAAGRSNAFAERQDRLASKQLLG